MPVLKENGSYGMVIRGGAHDSPSKCRPFTVVHVDKVNQSITFIVAKIMIDVYKKITLND